MQKRSIFIVAIVAVIALMAYPVFAGGPSKPSGKSNTGQLYLYEKASSDVKWTEGDCEGWLIPWLIVEGGAWGKMKYNLSGETFDFVFNGHGLPAGVPFTLIYYPDKHGDDPGPEQWPRTDIICLGEGTVNGEGNIHIAGSVDPGTFLPNEDVDSGDCNYDWLGAKIWLVLSQDVDCDTATMSGWNATAYLFEGDVIFFEYTP